MFKVVLRGLIACCILTGCEKPDTLETRRAENCGVAGNKQAWLFAQDAVKQNLKAPATAVFSSFDDPETEIGTAKGDICSYSVHQNVDAQNSYGALIRSKTFVWLMYSPETKSRTLLADVIIKAR
jgi:hypothetical protein